MSCREPRRNAAHAFALRLVLGELLGDPDACQLVLDDVASHPANPDIVGGLVSYLAGASARLLEKQFGADAAIDLVTTQLAGALAASNESRRGKR